MRFCLKIFCAFFLLFFSSTLLHASNFDTDADVRYDLQPDGSALATYNISIENTSETYMPRAYILTLTQKTIRDIQVFEDEKEIFAQIEGSENKTTIRTEFLHPVNGLGRKKVFRIQFVVDSVAQKSGEIWEVFIPQLASPSEFKNYTQTVLVPEGFGEEAYIHPEVPHTTNEGERVYTFGKDQVAKDGVTAFFGPHKVFSFDLTYHLQNDSFFMQKREIALPPDTSIQKVYLQEVNPSYDRIRIDTDGNWIAEYTLLPKQSLDVSARGQIQLFASPRKLLTPKPISFLTNLKSTQYWQSDDPEIVRIAEEIGKNPEDIYTYVVNTLDYNYTSATPDRERKGAVYALKRSDDSICMEFTDLFIALARAAGIPAREMNGYAFSENPKVQPLSLVADVLHSWPEYWDEEKGVWVPIDPTWADTTGGKDYFNTFDLNHVAFVIHGANDQYPFPAGSYKKDAKPQKDVFVEVLKDASYSQLETYEIRESKKKLTMGNHTWKLALVNTGNVALYEQEIHVFFDNRKKESYFISALPPKGSYEFEITTKSPIFGSFPEKIVVEMNGSQYLISDNPRNAMLEDIVKCGVILFSLLLLGGIMVVTIRFFKKAYAVNTH